MNSYLVQLGGWEPKRVLADEECRDVGQFADRSGLDAMLGVSERADESSIGSLLFNLGSFLFYSALDYFASPGGRSGDCGDDRHGGV